MSENNVTDTSFMTEDQLRAYNNIREEYADVFGNKEWTVAPVEGTDKVVITSPSDINSNMFEIYLPAEIDENTPSYTYYSPGGIGSSMRGSGGSGVIANAITNAIDEKNNAIFCMTSSDDKNELGLRTIQAIYGDNAFNSNTCIGWSEGGGTVYTRTLDKIRNNPDLEPQTMVFLDLQWNGGQLDTSEENLNLMKENGTVIMAFESVETIPEQYKTSQHYKEIAAAGIPLIIIEIPGDHGETPATVFQDNLLAFLNGEIDEIPSALGYYEFDENGNFVQMDADEAIKIMRQNLMVSSLFTSEQISDMYEKYKKEFASYNMLIRESSDNINSMMKEFLATDAGFLGNHINAITSKVNSTKLTQIDVSADYASTTNSPLMQDVKIMEYTAKTSELLSKVLNCVEYAMHAQLEIEATENDIKDDAADLDVSGSTTDAVLAGSIAGLDAAADALGYTGTKKQEYIESETAKLYEKYFSEEAQKEAENKGLSGEEKDKFVDEYINDRIKEFENNKDSYNVDVETNVSETNLNGEVVNGSKANTNTVSNNANNVNYTNTNTNATANVNTSNNNTNTDVNVKSNTNSNINNASTQTKPSEDTYIVQPGDTLGDIAKKYGMDYNDIAKDNNISDPNYILPGQKLIINNKNDIL